MGALVASAALLSACIPVADAELNNPYDLNLVGVLLGTYPTPLSSTITQTAHSPNTVSIGFFQVQETSAPSATVAYRLYASVSNNITTVAQAEANGTLLVTVTPSSVSTEQMHTTYIGLRPATTQYVNIVAESSGRKVAYQPLAITVSNMLGIFSVGTRHGNFGGRSGGDSVCRTYAQTNFPLLNTNQVRALVSVQAGDTIADMVTNYSIPNDRSVYRMPASTINTGAITQLSNVPTINAVATNFSDLIDGSLSEALVPSQFAGYNIYLSGTEVWSGATSTGGLDANHCTNWTSSSGTGRRASLVQSSTWLSGGGSGLCSGLTAELLCIAW